MSKLILPLELFLKAQLFRLALFSDRDFMAKFHPSGYCSVKAFEKFAAHGIAEKDGFLEILLYYFGKRIAPGILLSQG